MGLLPPAAPWKGLSGVSNEVVEEREGLGKACPQSLHRKGPGAAWGRPAAAGQWSEVGRPHRTASQPPLRAA